MDSRVTTGVQTHGGSVTAAKRWPFVAIALAAGLFVGLAPSADVLGWTAFFVAGAAIHIIALRTPNVRDILIAAFALRAALALTHAYVFPLPGTDADAVIFESWGWLWAENGMAGAISRFTSGAYLYSWLIALLYALTDRSELMIQMVNVFFGTLVVWNCYMLGRLLWGESAARRGAWVIALFPTIALFSAITMREVAVIYPLTLGVLFFVKWFTTSRTRWLLAAMVAFAVAIAFHLVVVGIILVALMMIALRSLRALLRGRVVAATQVLVGFALVVALVAVLVQRDWGNVDWAAVLTIHAVQHQQEVAAAERTAYLEGFISERPIDLIWQTPVRVVFFLFMPFPWLVSSPIDLVGLLDVSIYAGLIALIARDRKRIWANPGARTTLILAASAAVIFALVVANYGTAIRHRGKIAPLLAAVASAAMVRPRREGAGAPNPSTSGHESDNESRVLV
jgi:4-amino-4-deoxy-L-arabinose transferase-like glycosyltransferase